MRRVAAGGYRWRRRAQRAVPYVIWCAAVVAVALLIPQSRIASPVAGVVEVLRHSVVAPVDGRLLSLTVDLHAPVHSGQIVARLADEELKLRLASARAELERLRSQLLRRQTELEQTERVDAARQRLDVSIELRRRTDALESARVAELETQAEIEESRIRLQGATIEAARLGALGQQGIAADTELVRVRTERDALEKRVAELSVVLAQQREQVAACRARLEGFSGEDIARVARDTVLEPIRWQVRTQETELERIALESQRLNLIAPASGRVESVAGRAGQWVSAGDTLATVVETRPRRILAYVPDEFRPRIDVAANVQVVRDAGGPVRVANVLSVSPAPVLVPQRLWRDPRIEEWAWEVVLPAAGDESPGERVHVLLTP
jgi:multidrug resistance efflux pump